MVHDIEDRFTTVADGGPRLNIRQVCVNDERKNWQVVGATSVTTGKMREHQTTTMDEAGNGGFLSLGYLGK